MNPIATGALVGIAFAQLAMAWTAIEPGPQEVHFLAVQKYCKELTRERGPENYFACVAAAVNGRLR